MKRSHSVLSVAATRVEVREAGPGLEAKLRQATGEVEGAPSGDHRCFLRLFWCRIPYASVYQFTPLTRLLLPR